MLAPVMKRRTDERLTLSLFADAEEASTAQDQQQKVLEGVDELFAYENRRPLQCFTIKMPLPLYLEFKREVQHLQANADPELKQCYTMTAFVNAAVKKVILPSLKKISLHGTALEASDELQMVQGR
jgi:hypothetical protein